MRNPLQRGIAFLRESLRESDTDLTRGPLGRCLGLLAIPMMLEVSMESVFATVFMIGIGVLMIGFAPGSVALFSTDPEVVSIGISCLRILGIGFPMYAVGMVMTQALNGAGATGSPVAMNFLCFWLLQIPLAYWLATGARMGPDGAFAAIVVSESLLTVLSVIVFRRGRWRTRRV